MICARATLTAGPLQERYSRGANVRAVVFAKVASAEELKAKSFRTLAFKGWTRVRIDSVTVLADDHQFAQPYSAEAEAFRAALDSGLSIMVLGLVQ
jgi:hypothetical protein